MTKVKLIRIIQGLFKTGIDFAFLTSFKERDVETQVACIRERVWHGKN